MYSILRIRKIKTIAALTRSARHTFREQPTPNADPTKVAHNRIKGAKDSVQLINVLQDRLPERRRRDAVLCIEYLVTASPEAFERHGGHLDDLGSGYFNDALRWLKARHGAKNVISAAIHLDERTPHLVAYVVPLTSQGRLSARDFLGGPKAMRSMQDSFHNACGVSRGLQRGIQGSKAKHEDISSFYGMLSSIDEAPELSAKDYALRALGHKTQAWHSAEQVTMALAQNSKMEKVRSKRVSSKQRAMDNLEAQNNNREVALNQKETELAKRAREIEKQEKEISRRKPELDIALARVEGMERMIELLTSKANPTANLKKKTHMDYSSTLEFGRT